MTSPGTTTGASNLSGFGLGASVAGSAISAFGALAGGQAQSRQLQYQAGVADLNSKIALQNKDFATATGEVTAQRYGMAAVQRAGAIRAGIGASGIDIGSGSKAQVQEGQQTIAGIDLAQIRNNTARKAYGFDVEATQDTAQAGLLRSAAGDAESAGEIKALGSLVSGAGSVADKWYQGNAAFGSSKSGSNAVTSSGADASWYS